MWGACVGDTCQFLYLPISALFPTVAQFFGEKHSLVFNKTDQFFIWRPFVLKIHKISIGRRV
jgi:hypothetical protein